MIGVSAIHRRLAELQLKSTRLGGWHKLNSLEQMDLQHCLRHNAAMIQRLDELKQLSYIAYCAGDINWHHEICRQIEQCEDKF